MNSHTLSIATLSCVFLCVAGCTSDNNVTNRNGWTEITYSDGSMLRYSKHSVTNSDGIIKRSTHYERISPSGAVIERETLHEMISPGGAVSGYYVTDPLDY